MTLTPSLLRTVSVQPSHRIDPLWPTKRPNDQLDYWLDYTQFLSGLQAGASLSSYVVRVFGSDGALGVAQIRTAVVSTVSNSNTFALASPLYIYPGMLLIAPGVAYGTTVVSVTSNAVVVSVAVSLVASTPVAFNGTLIQGNQLLVMLAGGTPGQSYLVEVDMILAGLPMLTIKSDTIRIAVGGPVIQGQLQSGVVSSVSLLTQDELLLLGQSLVPSSAAILSAISGLAPASLQSLYALLAGSIPSTNILPSRLSIITFVP